MATATTSSRLLHARAFVLGGGEKTKRVLVWVVAGTEPIKAAATADILNRAGARVTTATADPAGGDGLVVEAACESSLSPTWRRGLQPHNPVSVPTGLRS
jgi:hypothetical protein